MNLTSQQKYFLPVTAVPILLTLFFLVAALLLGNPGFQVDKTQHGLRISRVTAPINPVQEKDLIIGACGISYPRILGYLFLRSELPKENTFTLLREGRELQLPLQTTPYSISSLLLITWPHLLLMAVFLFLGTTALLRAPPGKTTVLFFLMLTGFASSIAATLASHIGLLYPPVMSVSFWGIALFNWFSFGAWAHFTSTFPTDRDITRRRPWLPPIFYLLPPLTTVVLALVLGGVSVEFWGWVQRLRNMFIPLIICATFGKHLVDYKKLDPANPARNQIKISLAAFWLSFGPYLFFYLLPNLLTDHPLIYFRTVVLTFLILPLAYLTALLRYRLFDVDRIISRVMAYVFLIIGITLLYSLLIVSMKRWLWGKGVLSEELFLLFLVAIIILFNPAAKWLQDRINHYIFGNIPVNTTLLHDLSRRITTALQIEDMVRVLTHDLPRQFGLKRAVLLLLDNRANRIFPEAVEPQIKNLLERKTDLELITESKKECLPCQQTTETPSLSALLEKLRQQGVRLVFPLRGSSGTTGVLFVGEKTNNRLFTNDDIHFLATLANFSGVALENGLRYERLAESKKQQETIFKKLLRNEKMAAIGEMTTTLAHELKNPLATIRSSAQYIADSPRSPEVNREILGYIIEEVDALNLTISSLLGLARHRQPIFKSVDLETLVPAIVKRWQQSREHGTDITLTCDIRGPLPRVECDASQLSQVILNLICNAEEAIQGPGEVVVRLQSLDNHAFITILDTGPGIEPDHLRQVFNNFFTTKTEGLGLGLPTCRQLIHAHHGSINIKNRKGGGTEVLIQLPFHPFEESPDPLVRAEQAQA